MIDKYEAAARRLTSARALADAMQPDERAAFAEYLLALPATNPTAARWDPLATAGTPPPASELNKSTGEPNPPSPARIAGKRTRKEGKYRVAIRTVLADEQPRSTGELSTAGCVLDPSLDPGSFGNEVARMLVDEILVVVDNNGPKKAKRYKLRKEGSTV